MIGSPALGAESCVDLESFAAGLTFSGGIFASGVKSRAIVPAKANVISVLFVACWADLHDKFFLRSKKHISKLEYENNRAYWS